MVNVVLDAKQQSFKLCAVDGVDVVMSIFHQASACCSDNFILIFSTNIIRKSTSLSKERRRRCPKVIQHSPVTIRALQ